jgi:hypothetical protein
LGIPVHTYRQLPNEGKSREGDQNGQEDFEEGEEDGSDEAVDGWSQPGHPESLGLIFSLGSGSDPSPASLKSSSSDFPELLPAKAAALYVFGRVEMLPESSPVGVIEKVNGPQKNSTVASQIWMAGRASEALNSCR